MNFTDAVTVSTTRRTDDGYLIAEAFAVRSGVQRYLGSEVGRPDLKFVDVYRPESEVRDPASLRTFSHAPLTIDHPSESVNKDNWRRLGVGEVSTEAEWQDNRIKLPLIVKDASAIAAIEGGKRGLSAGYTCELVFGDGVTPEGEPYHATQTKIRANHLAIVDRGRAGDEFRIGDDADNGARASKTWGIAPLTNDHTSDKENVMTMTNVVLGDKAVQVAATDAPAIEAYKASVTQATADAKAEFDRQIAAKDAEIAKKDAEIDEITGKVLSDADLDSRVQARADLIATACKIAKDVKTTGLSDADIRKAVVKAKLGDAAISDKSDAYIEGRFDDLAERAAKDADPIRRVAQDGIRQNANDGWSDTAFASAGVPMKKEA